MSEVFGTKLEITIGRETISFFQITKTFFAIFLLVLLVGCSPEVGSDEWCGDMKEKPKKDWTAS
jgi:hypothetical protein